jgi:molybdopterin-binding protein
MYFSWVFSEICRLSFPNQNKEENMKISARNTLKGKVKKVTAGAVNSEVIVELPGGAEIVSIITKTSADALDLKEGKEVYAVIKASNVMIAVE